MSRILNEFLRMVSMHLNPLVDNVPLQEDTSWIQIEMIFIKFEGKWSLPVFIHEQLTASTKGLLTQEKLPNSFPLFT